MILIPQEAQLVNSRYIACLMLICCINVTITIVYSEISETKPLHCFGQMCLAEIGVGLKRLLLKIDWPHIVSELTQTWATGTHHRWIEAQAVETDQLSDLLQNAMQLHYVEIGS